MLDRLDMAALNAPVHDQLGIGTQFRNGANPPHQSLATGTRLLGLLVQHARALEALILDQLSAGETIISRAAVLPFQYSAGNAALAFIEPVRVAGP